MPTENPSFVYGEDIATSLIVKRSTAADHTVLKCGFGELPCGVSHEGSREAPIPGVTPYAALSGESARVYGPGETCEVDVATGVVVTAGYPVMADANSKARRGIHGMGCLGNAEKTVTGPARCRVNVRPHVHNNSNQIIDVATGSSPRTVVDYEAGATFRNTGGSVEFDLPPAVVGLEFTFQVAHASSLIIDPDGTETLTGTNGVPGSAGQTLVADAVSEKVTIRCNETGKWVVQSFTGTWTLT